MKKLVATCWRAARARRRHAWWLFLALALLLTGGRLRLGSAPPNVLRIAHTFTTASERAILDDAVHEFEQTHPPLRIEQIILNSDTYQTVGWRLQFQGRQQPDIYFHWQGSRVEYAIKNGWAMNLEPYLSPGFVAQFVPASIKRQHGGIYHLPQSVDISNLVWYNRDVFARLGLEEPATLEAWLATCQRLRRAGVLPLVQGDRDLWPMGNLGAELLGQTLGPARLDRLFAPGVPVSVTDLAGLKTFVHMEQEGMFDLPGLMERGAIGGFGDIDAKVFFLAGKAAQHVVGSWFLADIQDARQRGELHFPVGVFPVPAARGEINAMVAVSTGWLVNPATRYPAAAVAFLELLLSRKYQARFAGLGNLSTRRDAPEFTAAPLARRALEILAATPVTLPPPDTGYRPEQAYVFYDLCGKLLTGKLTLPAAADYWTREKQALARQGL